MSFPDTFLDHLEGLPGFSSPAFQEAHRSALPTSIRLNPFKPASLSFVHASIPWSKQGYYLAERPSFTFDPLFHAGTYYVQEASSQLLEPILSACTDLTQSLRVLDLCAAPGGKSTHLLSLLSENSLLVSNEVIRSRAGILQDNLDKWGCANVVVTQEDPAVLGKLRGFFDVIVVDAPCSGSGLFRKDPDAMLHWSPGAVEHCSGRQQRILKDIWPALKEGGSLIYSTCSYSRQEDEDMVQWILSTFDASLRLPEFPTAWGITPSDMGYRCWPHLMKGEGFFVSAIQKKSSEAPLSIRSRVATGKLSVAQRQELAAWWQLEGCEWLEGKDGCWAFPGDRLTDLSMLSTVCQPIRSGTRLGSWSRADFIPDHALALSRYRHPTLPRLELDRAESIRYLQRGTLERSGLEKGWQLATYQGHVMGWIKSLGNRLNNYYPTHLRILKQSIG